MTQEVLKLALEALELSNVNHWWGSSSVEKAITAIKKALAQTEQEPVRIIGFNCKCGRRMEVSAEQGVVPAFKRTWVGLTDEEICTFSMWLDDKSDDTVFTAIEAKLKQKNGFAEEKNT